MHGISVVVPEGVSGWIGGHVDRASMPDSGSRRLGWNCIAKRICMWITCFIDYYWTITFCWIREQSGFVQKILKMHVIIKSALAQKMSQPKLFEGQLFFHSLMFLEDCMQRNLVSTLHYYISGMPGVYVFSWWQWRGKHALRQLSWQATKMRRKLRCSEIIGDWWLRVLVAVNIGMLFSSSKRVIL